MEQRCQEAVRQVEKVLDADQTKACRLELCQTSSNLELLLKSDQFWMALERIYYKYKGEVGPLSAWNQRREFLNSLTVKCCDRLVVVQKISSHAVSAVPKKLMFTSANIIYIEHAAIDSRRISIQIGIAKFLEKYLPLWNCDNSTVLLLQLLECFPDVMHQVLAAEDIPDLPEPSPVLLSSGSAIALSSSEVMSRCSSIQNASSRDPDLGTKYFTQAEENLKTAQNMGDNCGDDSVVYMVHQAIELALKGLIFDETRIILRSHCLHILASEATRSCRVDPAMQADVLELINTCNADYIRMRYPKDYQDIPHCIYTTIDRKHALDHGVKIMDYLRLKNSKKIVRKSVVPL